MIEIDNPPFRPTFCSQCQGSIVWLWSPRRKAWLPFVGGHINRDVIRLCRHSHDRDNRYRIEPQPPEVLRAGAQRAREALPRAATRGAES